MLTPLSAHLLPLSHFTSAGGIISSASCGTQLDHAVLAVGYATDALTKQKYYLVKNSWGTSWSVDRRAYECVHVLRQVHCMCS
jgi:hypothetical protein